MEARMRRCAVLLALFVLVTAVSSQAAEIDARLNGAFRKPAQNGWIFVHLEGTPFNIGFQHGYLLAPEIQDAEKVVVLEQTRESRKDWKFFRNAARDMMWPHIEPEYREELQGISEGLRAKGVTGPVGCGGAERLLRMGVLRQGV
jgi:hypothetical protein